MTPNNVGSLVHPAADKSAKAAAAFSPDPLSTTTVVSRAPIAPAAAS
jgi:hypothetical protein